MKNRNYKESNEQIALFQWIKLNEKKYPQLSLMFAIPNGGKRNIITASILKREGVKSGVPDVFLPYPKDGFHGLFIEMKYGKNKPTENQLQIIEALKLNDYQVHVCYSCFDAINIILTYLN